MEEYDLENGGQCFSRCKKKSLASLTTSSKISNIADMAVHVKHV